MIELVIKDISGYNYYLIDKNGYEYNLNIEFYDLENKPKINDKIYMNKSLLSKPINQTLSFGSLVGNYGRKITSSDDEDIIILKRNDKNIYLKRFYG